MQIYISIPNSLKNTDQVLIEINIEKKFLLQSLSGSLLKKGNAGHGDNLGLARFNNVEGFQE